MKFQICYPLNQPFVVSQRWGENYDYYHVNFNEWGHNGWDFSVPTGTPVYATHDGTVFSTSTDSTGSQTLTLDSADGYDYKGQTVQYRTYYAHLSEFCVKSGQVVKRGDLIAKSGNTGRYTSGPHLHFGVHPIHDYLQVDGNNGFNGAVDPIKYFDGTYPNMNQIITQTSTTKTDFFANMMLAVKAYQLSKGIMDFANESNPKKIRIGNKTLAQIAIDSK